MSVAAIDVAASRRRARSGAACCGAASRGARWRSPGSVVAVLFVLIAILAPLIAPYDPAETDFGTVLQSPSWSHPFGTDELGRDVLSRAIYGAARLARGRPAGDADRRSPSPSRSGSWPATTAAGPTRSSPDRPTCCSRSRG